MNIEAWKEHKKSGISLTRHIWIFGTGLLAKDVTLKLKKKGYIVNGFLNREGSFRNEVVEIGKCLYYGAAEIDEGRKEDSVIIAVFNPYANVKGIIGKLEEAGYKNIVTYPQLLNWFPNEMSCINWLCPSDKFLKAENNIVKAYEVLKGRGTDRRSLDIYESLVKFRITGDYNDLIQTESEPSYIVADICVWGGGYMGVIRRFALSIAELTTAIQ